MDDLVALLRVLIMDIGASPTYSDDTLKDVLVVGALQVFVDLALTDTYTVDINAQTITPNPADSATKDDGLVNLITQKSACIIDRGSAMVSAGQAIFVKDGSSWIDLRGISTSKLALLTKGWCAVYDDTLFDYFSGQRATAGIAIMGPFRAFAYGNPIFGYETGNGTIYR